MNGWGFAGRAALPDKFEEQYHCYSVAYADKAHLEGGDKILLPPSAFDTLARLNVDYPMLFQLQSPDKGTMTHCGVLEFTAEEGSCYVPFWMMQNLLIEEGALLTVANISLPKATFVKLQPQHVDFLDIANPRAVLEHALRNFSCVTKGDVICVPYNNKNYHFMMKEVKPQDAACIIETDCNVDFDAPVGYKEPERPIANGNGGGSEDFANMPRQSAYGDARSSACPSPALSSTSVASGSVFGAANGSASEDAKPRGTRIENGMVIRPDEDQQQSSVDPQMLASTTGATGVQRNSVIPVKAPQVDYWAVNAGDGARLDGKKPVGLKDKEGNEIDVRKLRADAAAARLASLPAKSFPTEDSAAAKPPPKQRKSRIGNKYSSRKTAGASFGGQGNKLQY